MIIRKPYAFLIKYFKIIHIIIFLLITYFLFQIRNVYVFFSNFLKTGTYTYVADIASKYVNVFMIIAVIILVGFFLLIFFLMKQKQKPVFYYLSASIFYFITFISLIFFLSVFNNLEYQTYSNQALVIFRDLTMVLYYLNFYFLVIAFVRGFGFNVKKFNFEKDIKELDITDADREEIELGTGFDPSKVSNYLRRKKRNIGYYFKENSFILIVFAVVVVLSITAYVALNKLVFNKTFHEMDVVSINNLDYKINASYVTNKDKYGNIIKNKNVNYLIVNFNISNNSNEGVKLNIKNTRIKIKNDYYYPVTNVSSKFSDLGVNYKSQTISSKANNQYILIYEIENADIESEKIILQIYYGKKVNNGEANLYYKDVLLKPYRFEDKDNTISYKLNQEISLKDSYLKDGKFKINSYEIVDIVNYTYTKCNNKCVEYNASVVPNSGKKILIIDYTSSINNVDLFTYLNLNYKMNGKEINVRNSNTKVVTPTNYETNKALVEVPSDVSEAENLKFIFDLWGYKFSFQ